MTHITVNFENCYGIKKLKNDFNFSETKSVAIYAPNGVMKTSFARSFFDLSKNQDSHDLVFKDRVTIREIKDENAIDILPEEILVIEPYNETYSSDRMSTLLVNKELKKDYDLVHRELDGFKDKLIKALGKLSGLKGKTESELSLTFTNEQDQLFLALGRLEKEILDSKEPAFSEIPYQTIFNDKVQKFLSDEGFLERLNEYMVKYNELIDQSNFFKKGVFNHNNASVIAKSLMDNGFFQASHTILMHGKKEEVSIKNKEELEKLIESEKQAILTNPDLVKSFEKIDSILKGNAELRSFRDYLLQHIDILPELQNVGSFKQKIWISYLKSSKEEYVLFIDKYKSAEDKLNKIVTQAKAEAPSWAKVIEIFNKRFSVPFKMEVENQVDVVLKEAIPNINFTFEDQFTHEQVTIGREDLLKVLSSGEKKALYLLNVIFDIEARKAVNQKTLFVVDDIAESFDYKNKYAIIEYLKDISEETSDFIQIILTHNFDFFRTIESRFVHYKNCFMVEKSATETKIVHANYINNPFKNDWIKNLNDDKKFVASIPILRNLIEYVFSENDPNYLKLTSLLHIKSDTLSIKKHEIQDIFNSLFKTLGLTVTDPNKLVYDLIFELAEDSLSAPECINLENKIILSMAIRLKAEEIMKNELTNTSECLNQTGVWFNRYKDEFGGEPGKEIKIKTLGEVNLMTPENIHFNSFMYEPILDISDSHLRSLYTRLKAL